jgi:hypothetical protein
MSFLIKKFFIKTKIKKRNRLKVKMKTQNLEEKKIILHCKVGTSKQIDFLPE